MALWKPFRAGPKTIRSLYHWVYRNFVDVGENIGDEGGTLPPDPPPTPGHQHWHDNLINVTPNQHHNQVHEFFGPDHLNIPPTFPPDPHTISFHDDVDTETNPKLEGQGIWWDVETSQWMNRAPYQEAFPTGLGDGGELNIGPGANDIEVIAGAGAVIDAYTTPLAPPALKILIWDQINTPITAAPAVAGSLVWFAIQDTGIPAVPPQYGGVPAFDGQLVQYATPPTPSLAKMEIFLGVAIHNGTEWKEISNPKVINQASETLREFLVNVTGPTHIISGGEVTESGTFEVDQAEGVVWEQNRNWHVDKSNPNRETLPASAPVQFRYVNRDFSDVGALTPTFNPDLYDNGTGAPVTVPGGANTTTIQKLYIDPANNYWVLWGQFTYASFYEAEANLQADLAKSVIPFILQNSILLGFAVMEKGKNNWDPNEAVFIPAVGGGGQSGGGGAPITDHDNLNGITPDNHHNQVHLLYGSDHSDIDIATPLAPAHLLDWDGATWLPDYRVKALPWSNGNTYYPQEMVWKGGYLMVANTETTDDPEPTPNGNPLWAIEDGIGAPTFSTLTAAEPVYLSGIRFTVGATGGQLNGYRWYMPDNSGNFTYEVWQADSGGNLTQLVAPGVFNTVGWYAIPSSGLLLPGVVFDLMVVGRAISQPNTFTANWDVKNSNGNPSAGEAWFQNNNTEIRVHHEDKLGADQEGNLDAVTVGGTLQFAGQTWTITSKTEGASGTFNTYGLSPNQGRPTEDERSLTFSWGSVQPIPYVEDAGHLSGAAGIAEGFKDTDYPPAALNDNAYGVDVNIEALVISPDWDIFGIPGGGGGTGGGGGGLEPHVLDYHDDVTIDTPLNQQALVFDSADSQWKNTTLPSGVTDHGALTGLTDDDHPQYHTDARGDARYSLLGHTHTVSADAGNILQNGTDVKAYWDGNWNDLTQVPTEFPPSSHPLDSHSDVSIITPASGQVLKYNGADWINAAVDWGELTGVPATFPPSAHDHLGEPWFDDHTHEWADITDPPSTFPPDPHNHDGYHVKVAGDTMTGTLHIQTTGVSEVLRLEDTTNQPFISWYPAGGPRAAYIQATTGIVNIVTENNAGLRIQSDNIIYFSSYNTPRAQFHVADFRPETDDAIDLGTSARQWKNVYATSFFEGNANINTIYAPIVHGHDWSEITGKPSTFPPDPHTLASHSDVTVTALAEKQVLKNVGGTWVNAFVDWGELIGVPATFPPSAHTHVEADITDLDKYTQAEVDSLLTGKSDVGHGHAVFGISTDGFVPGPASSSGLFLKDDGTWAAPPGGTSYWDANGDDIYNNNVGYVGIGTNAPSAELTVYDGHIHLLATGVNRSAVLMSTFDRVTPAVAGQRLFRLNMFGQGSDLADRSGARIEAYAAETWSPTASGGELAFVTTQLGTNTVTERMRIDANGFVGIGTTTPGRKLTVESDQTSVMRLKSTNVANGAWIDFQPADEATGSAIRMGAYFDQSWVVLTSNTERMRITNTGEVRFSSLAGSGTQNLGVDNNGELVITGGGSGYWGPSGTDDIINTNSGSVGIGVAPENNFHVFGQMRLSRGTNPNFYFKRNGIPNNNQVLLRLQAQGDNAAGNQNIEGARIQVNADETWVDGVSSATRIMFFTNQPGSWNAQTERMRITGDGLIKMGGPANLPLRRLHIQQDAEYQMIVQTGGNPHNGILLDNITNSGTNNGTFGLLNYSNVGSQASFYLQARNDDYSYNNNLMQITHSGGVSFPGGGSRDERRVIIKGPGTGTTTYSLIAANATNDGVSVTGMNLACRDDGYVYLPETFNKSDTGGSPLYINFQGGYLHTGSSTRKKKREIVNYTRGLNDLMQIRPVWYRPLENSGPDGQTDHKRYSGFIAEEIDDLGLEEYVVRNAEDEVVSLDYHKMVVLLVASVKELKGELEQLRHEVLG